ncbi:MAG: hypothetical protein NT038_00170 [Euryarchaeota archaeon]|nr:hypothetical protein [Euryarchaeota archaeon]
MKKIIIGAIFVGIILMLVPSISAIQYKTVVDINKSRILDKIKTINIDVLKEKLQNTDEPRFLAYVIAAIIIISIYTGAFLYFIFHCLIGNFIKVLFEVIYLKLHPDVDPW